MFFRRLLVFFCGVPTLILGSQWFYHFYDLVYVQGKELNDNIHPWIVFSAIITVSFLAVHTAFIMCTWFSWCKEYTTPANQTYLLKKDVTWNSIWVAFIVMQCALNKEYRIYNLEDLYIMLAMYIVQTLFLVPLLYMVRPASGGKCAGDAGSHAGAQTPATGAVGLRGHPRVQLRGSALPG